MTRPFGALRAACAWIAALRTSWQSSGGCRAIACSTPSRPIPPRTLRSSRGRRSSSGMDAPTTRRPTCRCSPGIACARRPDASRSCLPMAARCTSTPTPPWISSRTSSCGCSTDVCAWRSRDRTAKSSYRVDAPSAWAQITQPGEYRVAILRGDREPEVELAVIRGTAELVNEGGRTALRAGERAFSRANAAPSYAYAFNSATWDEFDRWSESRRDERRGVSAQYLPNEVRPYSASFDRYGSWQHEASYGYVWYPTVSVGWRPYYHGRWATLRPYGWTWIGSDPWAWPTHHYGRWGFSAGLWFWIPGRSWAPAWVSWAYAPGYVSWCPLGWNNRPIFGVNFYGGRYNAWHAWTVVPRHHFGHGNVHARVVHGDRFDARTRRSFVAQNTAPASRGFAVPRASAPIRSAGTRSTQRGSSPVYTNLEPGASRVGSAPSRTMVGPSRGSVAEASPGRSRAVPRGSATELGVPAGGADRSGVSSERSRAVPRAGATEFGVPAASADSGGGRSRAVPRGGVTEYGSRALPIRGPAARTAGSHPRQRHRARSGTRRPIAVHGPFHARIAPIADRSLRRSASRTRPSSGATSRQARGLCLAPATARRPTTAASRTSPGHRSPIAVRRARCPGRRQRARGRPRPSTVSSPPSRSGGDAARSAPAPSSDRPSGSSAGSARPRSGGQSSSGTAQPRGGGRR